MSTQTFYIASAYAQLFLRASQLPAPQVLRLAGLDEQALRTQAFLDLPTIRCLMHRIDELVADPAWAARTGAVLSSVTHGPAGFAALSAPTLGEALQVLAEFHTVRVNTFHIELHQHARYCELRMINADLQDAAFTRWISECVMRVFESLIATIMGHAPGVHVQINFVHERPFYADSLKEIYSARLGYGCEHTALLMPRSWWNIHSPLANADSYRTNIVQCRAILAELAREKSAVALVEHLLAQHFEQMLAGTATRELPPTQSELAQAVFITPRTLIRRLQAEGGSYRSILETCRRRYAEQLLKQSQLSVADIAHLLGYRESANFGRAFRQWYGCAPGAWRRESL